MAARHHNRPLFPPSSLPRNSVQTSSPALAVLHRSYQRVGEPLAGGPRKDCDGWSCKWVPLGRDGTTSQLPRLIRSMDEIQVLGGLAMSMQLGTAAYALRLNRVFGTDRAGWSLFGAFTLMLAVHLSEAWRPG